MWPFKRKIKPSECITRTIVASIEKCCHRKWKIDRLKYERDCAYSHPDFSYTLIARLWGGDKRVLIEGLRYDYLSCWQQMRIWRALKNSISKKIDEEEAKKRHEDEEKLKTWFPLCFK